MESKLDELFKAKLAHHAMPPSDSAWEKLQTGLVKKNRPIIIWRMAAALLLMGCFIAAIYQMQTPDGLVKKEIAQKNEAKENEVKANPSIEPAKKENVQEEEKISTSSLPKIVRQKAQTNLATVIKEDIQPTSLAEVKKEGEPGTNDVVAPSLQVETKAPSVANVEKPIVLEFTLAPIEPQTVANTTAEKKGFKKFFEKAKDLKNGEGGIDLADFTSKLFASNNKQDKNKESIN